MTTKLDDRIQSLEDKLSQLKVRQARAEARQRTLAARRARKEDTRRKILVGAIVLEKVSQGTLNPATFRAWLETALTSPKDRELFELPPIASPAVVRSSRKK